jgi:hypothetical protein
MSFGLTTDFSDVFYTIWQEKGLFEIDKSILTCRLTDAGRRGFENLTRDFLSQYLED